MEDRAVKAFKVLRELNKNQKLTPKEAVKRVTKLGYVWENEDWVLYKQVALEELTFAEAVKYLHHYDLNAYTNLFLEDEAERFHKAVEVISQATGLSQFWLGAHLFAGDETVERLQEMAKADPAYA